MTETELIRRAQRGDRGAFGELVALHQARIRALIACFVANGDDVLDLAQDTFFDALRNLDRFDPQGDFKAWLRGIARHRVLNHFRSDRVRRARGPALLDETILERLDANLDREPGLEARIEALRACVNGLPEPKRRLVRLRYERGVAVHEIAEATQRTPSDVSVNLGRVRRALAQCVERRLRGETP